MFAPNPPLRRSIDPLAGLSSPDESLDQIIREVIGSDINMGYYASSLEPCLKKRKCSLKSEATSDEHEQTPDSECSVASIMERVRNAPERVFLSRDELLHLNSDDFDDYKKVLSSKFALTVEEREIIKKQRRVIKNREYSQSSRQKKRQRAENLEEQIATLKAENATLREENSSLKQKIWKIVGAYQRTQSHKHLPSTADESLFASVFSIQAPSSPLGRNVGACLFVILLSFGLIFSLNGGPLSHSLGSTSTRTGRIILSTEDTWPNGLSLWWDGVLEMISSSISSAQKAGSSGRSESLTFVTTFTTSIDTQFSKSTTSSQESAQPNPQSWDDTHICDFQSASLWSEHFIHPNKSIPTN